MRTRRLRKAFTAAVLAFAAAGSGQAMALSPEQARGSLNAWRASTGLPPVSTLVSDWNTGCEHHNTYMTHHGLTHYETGGDQYATPDGSKAGLNSVLAQGFSGATPKEIWDSGVFHRVPLLAPRLRRIGFDELSGFSCLWVQNQDQNDSPQALDNSPAARTSTLKLYPSPANHEQKVPTAFPENESPDPHGETGVQPADHLGWLLSVEVNGPWDNGYSGYSVNTSVSHASLAPVAGGAAVPLAISQQGPPSTSYGLYMREGFGLFPRQILHTGTTYRATASGTVHTPNGSLAFTNFRWTFRTGGPSHECTVPSLGGKSLRQAKSALQHARCALGKVTKPHPKPGHHLGSLVVASQSPRAHSIKPVGAKVAVRLKRK